MNAVAVEPVFKAQLAHLTGTVDLVAFAEGERGNDDEDQNGQ